MNREIRTVVAGIDLYEQPPCNIRHRHRKFKEIVHECDLSYKQNFVWDCKGPSYSVVFLDIFFFPFYFFFASLVFVGIGGKNLVETGCDEGGVKVDDER